jgi:uncharacterized membrane protein YqjE
MAKVGVVLLVLATVAVLWPLAVAVPVAVLGVWLALALLAKAWRLRRSSPESVIAEGDPAPGGAELTRLGGRPDKS